MSSAKIPKYFIFPEISDVFLFITNVFYFVAGPEKDFFCPIEILDLTIFNDEEFLKK